MLVLKQKLNPLKFLRMGFFPYVTVNPGAVGKKLKIRGNHFENFEEY